MLCKCLITGAKYQLPSWNDCPTPIETLHPALLAPINALSAMRPPSTTKDANLYFYSWLHKCQELGKIRYTQLPVPILDVVWIAQRAGKLAKLACWLSANSSSSIIKKIPAFHITHETNELNLQAWIDECLDIIQTNQALYGIVSKNTISIAEKILSATVEQESEIDYSAMDGERIKPPVFTEGRALIKWIFDSFANKQEINRIQYAQLKRTVTKPSLAQLPALRQTKHAVLCYGAEQTMAQYNIKESVINLLEKAIVKRRGVANILSSNAEDEQNEDGFNYNILTVNPNPTPIAVPTSAPNPADYPNKLAYFVAQKKWDKQQKHNS